MENLSLNDAGAPSSPQRGPGQQQLGNPVFAGTPPQGAPQLPPQMFTTAAQLLDLTDSMSRPRKFVSFHSSTATPAPAESAEWE